MGSLSDGLFDRASSVFLCSVGIFPAWDLFDEREPTARKTYLDLAPQPRPSGLGPGAVDEREVCEGLASNGLRPARRWVWRR
jgi:hypothetical protein